MGKICKRAEVSIDRDCQLNHMKQKAVVLARSVLKIGHTGTCHMSEHWFRTIRWRIKIGGDDIKGYFTNVS